MDRLFNYLGYIRPATLLVVLPDIPEMLKETEEALDIGIERAQSLKKEAETKLESAERRLTILNREKEAIEKFRTALGERK